MHTKKRNASLKLFMLALILSQTERFTRPMGVPQATAGAASVAAVLGTPMAALTNTLKALQAGSAALHTIRNCLYSVGTARTSADPKKTNESGSLKALSPLWESVSHALLEREKSSLSEQKELNTSKTLRIMQLETMKKAVELMLTAYSPAAHPCDRVESLFALNGIRLLGIPGRRYHEFLSRINKHYFNYDGTLKWYDPTKQNCDNPLRVKELISFLNRFCCQKKEYLDYLQEGIKRGITALHEQYDIDVSQAWMPKTEQSMWNYSLGILHRVTGINIASLITIDPYLVCLNKTNRDFIRVINYCVENNDFFSAQQIINKHKTVHNGLLCKNYEIMQQYYIDAYNRFKSIKTH